MGTCQHLGPEVHGPQAEAQRRAQEVDEGHLTLLEVAHHAATWTQVLLASDACYLRTSCPELRAAQARRKMSLSTSIAFLWDGNGKTQPP